MVSSSAPGPLLKALDPSTVLAPTDALQRLLASLEKHHLIWIVLAWIREAQQAPSPSLLPPQLSRRAPRQRASRLPDKSDLSQDDMRAATSSFLDLHEERRARSYKELTSLWLESMSDAKVPRSRAVDRIVNVDWPTGLTYAMVATVSFECVRASPMRRVWHTIRLDFGDDEERRQVRDKGESSGSTARAILQRLTPQQLRERFSAELRHYCSHAVFLDSAVQADCGIDGDNDDLLGPLPDNWCRFFTHLRVITNLKAVDVSSKGLHILHIPHSSWCLVSGALGPSGSEVREMALTALANSVGARRIKSAQEALQGDEAVVEMGKMAELSGKDPLGLRDVLLSAGLIGERDEGEEDGLTGGGVGGGKGRSMKRGEAEDGPLIRAEKRRRDEGSGLYAELEEREQAWEERNYDEDDWKHPALQQQAHWQKRRRQQGRVREVDELFGKYQDLPRLERVRYEMSLPFPALNGYGRVSEESIQSAPIVLRLQGSHILAGLQRFVAAGLDCANDDDGRSAGLPTWLTEIRGTRVSIGLDAAVQSS